MEWPGASTSEPKAARAAREQKVSVWQNGPALVVGRRSGSGRSQGCVSSDQPGGRWSETGEEKRTPKLPLSRASMDARCPCARTPSKKRESAWHAHGSHGLQGAFALVSGLYGAWETRSACGALVGSRKHRSRRAQGGARTQRLLPFSG